MAPLLMTLTTGTTLNDLEGHFPVAPFQVQSVEHLCSILPDFNSQRARAVRQRQVGFLYQMLFSSVSKMVELKENEKWSMVRVTILTRRRIFWQRFDFYRNSSISCVIILKYQRRRTIQGELTQF